MKKRTKTNLLKNLCIASGSLLILLLFCMLITKKTTINDSQILSQKESSSSEQENEVSMTLKTSIPSLMPTATPTGTPNFSSHAPAIKEESSLPNTTEQVITHSPSAKSGKTASPAKTSRPASSTPSPTKTPVSQSTKAPVVKPTKVPTIAPTKTPTAAPTKVPTTAPTKVPTAAPTATPNPAPTNSTPTYRDGAYTGSGTGRNGLITVSVRIRGGKIYRINVLSHEETDTIFARSTAVLDKIISAQSTNVDVISGATYSSNGLKEAVQNAINQAKN